MNILIEISSLEFSNAHPWMFSLLTCGDSDRGWDLWRRSQWEEYRTQDAHPLGGIGTSASSSCSFSSWLTGEQFLQALPLWQAPSSWAWREDHIFSELHRDVPFEGEQRWGSCILSFPGEAKFLPETCPNLGMICKQNSLRNSFLKTQLSILPKEFNSNGTPMHPCL